MTLSVATLTNTPTEAEPRTTALAALMLLGDREHPMVADASRAIAACLTRCRTMLVPGADHLLPLRAPALLADAIAEVAG